MTLLVNFPEVTDFLEAFVATFFFFAAIIQWVRHRHCAYHMETGYWMMLGWGFFFIAIASFGKLFVMDDVLGVYTALTLKLVGYLALLVALLRLFSWNAHRHTEAP